MTSVDVGQISVTNSFYISTWTIENFTLYCEKEDPLVEINSPIFTLNSDLSMKLKLRINNKPIGEMEKGYLKISLHLLRECNDPIKAEFDFCLLNSQNMKLYSLDEPLFYTFLDNMKWKIWCRRSLVKKNTVTDANSNLLVEDQLKIQCSLNILDGKINELPLLFQNNLESERLFHDKDFSDAILNVDGEELKVHKAILASKSPVFYAMFCNNTKEANDNLVEINDFSFDVIKDMVQYIYTGDVKDLEKHPEDLLAAADKYCIEGLKLLCCRYFHDNLNIENAVEYFLLSERHHLKNFACFVENFISDNLYEVLETDEFRKAKDTQPGILLDLVCRAIKKNKI